MKLSGVWLPLILVCALVTANAVGAPHEFPEQIVVANKVLVLNGFATRSGVDGKSVYTVALYLENSSNDANRILESDEMKRSIMLFDKPLKFSAARKMLFEDLIVNLEPEQLSAVGPEVVEFVKLAPPDGFKQGDWIQFDHFNGEGTVVTYNGTRVGLITGKALYQALLLQWIGSRPIDRKLKKAILGQGIE
ncbi:chalcone isomerase-like protein [Pseudomonas sp. SJZ079]|uniref:chalcone isomerase family protein n=1 Tax=Pseudomonas sp. SJZ079 TaxID=2572887 RepID=UPI001199A01A|nr:chalcone isomerase family protein [Pseudomonas sp. SJZ079]TWC27944.1 chalcone isomerase-like protein [Pseudomonas sp. SJZ079]